MNNLRALVATLRESAPFCQQCAKRAFDVIEARDYRKKVAQYAARDKSGHDWTSKLAKAAEDLDHRVRWAEEHLGEPHEEPEEKPTKAPRARKVKVDDGKVVCPKCGGRATPHGENQIGAHRSPWGGRCTRRLLKVVIEAPPVNLPEPVAAVPVATKRASSVDHSPAWNSPTGHCHTCDKRVTGERRFCGQCARKRGTS